MSGHRIVGQSGEAAGGCLSKAIAFDYGTAEANLQQVEHIRRYRRGPCEHQSDITANECLHLLKDELVPNAVGQAAICIVIGLFCGKSVIDQCRLASGCRIERVLNLAINSIEDSGNRREQCWFQCGQVFCNECEGIASVESASHARHE